MTTTNDRAIDWLLRDNHAVEIRALSSQGRTHIGVFEDADRLQRAIEPLRQTHNLYATLNRPMFAVAKPMQPASSGLGNDDIDMHTRLLFDFDPVRPAGTNSTNEELEAARQQAMSMQAMLSSAGWPEPLTACSGNGWHLVYRCKLPANEATRRQLATLYQRLGSLYSNDQVLFDRTVRNPGRICRLYGTVNRKAPSQPGRPQRLSGCHVPRDWRCVPRSRLLALCKPIPKPKRSQPAEKRLTPLEGAGDYCTLDVVAWFRSHGLWRKHGGEDRHNVKCPWSHEHSTASPPDHGDCNIWETSRTGWPGFDCKHDHCDGRGILDVINHLGDADAFCSRLWRAS